MIYIKYYNCFAAYAYAEFSGNHTKSNQGRKRRRTERRVGWRCQDPIELATGRTL